MTQYNSRMLTPPQEEDVFPFLRVWPSIVVQSSVLFVICGGIFAAVGIFGLSVPAFIKQPVNLLIAVLPLGLWIVFAFWRERSVVEPRQQLLTVVIITALAANAVGIPFIEGVFQTERWLPLAAAPVRIVGYTITVGSFQELIKYLVLRYTVWGNHFRIRQDSVAYGFASAVGYATVLNLHFVLSTNTDAGSVALFTAETMALQAAASIIVAYGMSELRFSTPTPLLLPITIVMASFIFGGLIPLRAGFVNARFSLRGGFPNPLLGLAVSAAVFIGLAVIFAFLFERADRADREAAAGAA
ncbi:MAG: hypothetical protein U0670_13470 [Anaerolineae bacterium]